MNKNDNKLYYVIIGQNREENIMAKSTFSQMRKQSSNLETLQSKLKSKKYADDRFWKAEQDKAGNAQAVIRFLPAPDGEDDPFIKFYSYFFEENGKRFIENCPSTIGGDSPVMDHNGKLWNSGNEDDKEIVRRRKRRTNYYSNVYIVKDPANPENEGKVFLFKYGKKIFEKIENAISPKFEGDEPFNPFDFWEGADFKLRIVKKEGYANYDNSSFDTPKPLLDDDKELENIWNQEYSLQEFLNESNFRSYEELEKKFLHVIGEDNMPQHRTIEEKMESDVERSEVEDTLASVDTDDDDDDDDLESLRALVK
jgi:hypothetical protein